MNSLSKIVSKLKTEISQDQACLCICIFFFLDATEFCVVFGIKYTLMHKLAADNGVRDSSRDQELQYFVCGEVL